VTRRAFQFPAAPQEALGSHQSVGRVVDRNAIDRRGLDELEIQYEITKRLAWPVGEWPSSEVANCVGKRTAEGFQMALRANFDLAFRT
jgi:hypothetical protein